MRLTAIWEYIECSQCRETVGGQTGSRFCPNCGAKMDEEEKMTNKEAIAVLKENYCGIGSNDLFVFRKAIEALENAEKERGIK